MSEAVKDPVVTKNNPEMSLLERAYKQEVQSMREREEFLEWVDLPDEEKIERRMNELWPDNKAKKRFRCSIPKDPTQPTLTIRADNEYMAHTMYREYCGILSHEHPILADEV